MAIEAKSSIDSISSGLYNHSIVTLSDAISIPWLLSQLDPTITLGSSNGLLSRASAQNATMLEAALDALRKMLLGPSAATTPAGDRDAFYANLFGIQTAIGTGGSLAALVGKVQLTMPTTSAATARSDFGQFLAPYHLAPFALQTGDADAFSILKSANRTIADQWSADAALTQAERDAGKANYSDAWLTDRASMLSWVLKANAADTAFAANALYADAPPSLLSGDTWNFDDRSSGLTVLARPQELWNIAPAIRNVVFGSAATDSILGGSVSDRLYGGMGDDVLERGCGNDAIFGGLGKDALSACTPRDKMHHPRHQGSAANGGEWRAAA